MWWFHFHLNRRYTKHWCLSHEALGILLNYSSLSFPGLVLLETSVIHDKMYEGSGDIVDPPPPCCFPDSSSWKQVHFITNTSCWQGIWPASSGGIPTSGEIPPTETILWRHDLVSAGGISPEPVPVKYRQPKSDCGVTIWFRLAVFHRNWRYSAGTGWPYSRELAVLRGAQNSGLLGPW